MENRKTKIVFIFQVPSFWPSWESLYKRCVSDDSCEVSVYLLNNSSNKVQMNGSEEFLIENDIPYEGFAYYKIINYRPDYVVFQTPYDKGHRPFYAWSSRFRNAGIKTVYIPYGIEISDTEESRYKHFSLSAVVNAYAVFTLSESMKREYEKYCTNSGAVVPSGHPRFDVFKDKPVLDEKLKEKIGGRKKIVWKVHFPKIFVEDGIEKQATPDLSEYLKFSGYIKEHSELFFIFMPHPMFCDTTVRKDLREMAQKLMSELEQHPNVYIDQSADYHRSLLNADAIMVDRSAIMVEAGAVGVPVMYMYNKDYNEPMTEPIQKLIDSYEKGISCSDMAEFCDRISAGQDLKKAERTAAVNEVIPYTDGSCAERILEYLKANKDVEIRPSLFSQEEGPVNVAVWGAGAIGKYCYKLWRKPEKYNILYYIDKNPQDAGDYFEEKGIDVSVVSPDIVKTNPPDYIVIASDKYYREIREYILKNDLIDKDRIVYFDEFAVNNML